MSFWCYGLKSPQNAPSFPFPLLLLEFTPKASSLVSYLQATLIPGFKGDFTKMQAQWQHSLEQSQTVQSPGRQSSEQWRFIIGPLQTTLASSPLTFILHSSHNKLPTDPQKTKLPDISILRQTLHCLFCQGSVLPPISLVRSDSSRIHFKWHLLGDSYTGPSTDIDLISCCNTLQLFPSLGSHQTS